MVLAPEKPALQTFSGMTQEHFEELWDTVMEKLRDPANRAALAGPHVDEDGFDDWITSSLVSWAGRAFWPTGRPENTWFWAEKGDRDDITMFWVRIIEYLGRVMRIVIGLEDGHILSRSEDSEMTVPAAREVPVGISASSSRFFKAGAPHSKHLQTAIDFVDSTTVQHMNVANIKTLGNLIAVLEEEYCWGDVAGLWVEVGGCLFPIALDDDGSHWLRALGMCGSTVVIWVEV